MGARELTYLCRELKAPSLLAGVERLGERARAEAWSHEEFLAACLEREVSARQSHGGEARIRAARFPARKSLEDFDFDHQRSVRADVVAHLGALDFIEARSNAVFLGPPGTGKATSRSPSASAPAWPGIGSPSLPPPNGSTGSVPPMTPDACRAN
jgi:DNA replication protein DnaC